ncbi:MAG: prepilin-type N-terminal cleavage/methylation domain-containing protein [Candidatus Azotimanducaceae bacterium]|jgi:prepilin-type N-terminal cleavage/methylation domain-containing protein|tara:strand:+ start:1021 stop:2907 length:1887 start_codon:yes stop_codon:yes gene_type:complete
MRRVRVARPQPKNDGGFTLPELLVAMSLSGVLVAAMALAISVMLTTAPQAEIRLSESKDITFLQTWVPVDLSSAINSYDNPDEAELKAEIQAGDPSMSYNASLAGTNVLTLVLPDLAADGYLLVSYRYELSKGDWLLARYKIKYPGTASETSSRVGVASEVKDPPTDGSWSPGTKPVHAFEITSRNQVVLRPIGENITVYFASGNEFSTGGAGLSAERDLTPNDPVTLADPTAPPTRCGGRVALVLDTSWSVPGLNGGSNMEAAAIGFIDSFQGTPTTLTVMGFDSMAYQLYPNLNGVRGNYIDLLNPSSDIENAKTNIRELPNVDTQYPASSPEGNGFEESSGHYLDPTGAGVGTGSTVIGWSKMRQSETGLEKRGATNWEDALHAPFFTEGTATVAGDQRALTPETVVWITDGEPTTNREEMFYGQISPDFLTPARIAANAGRSTGARIIGVLVGPGSAALEQNLAEVVGGNKWTGSVDLATGEIDLQNAVSADYFTGDFDQLGDVLRSIMAAQCGGTVTVQKEIIDGIADGMWTYSTNIGDSTLDLDLTSSLTFDFSFDGGDTVRDVLIHEEVRDGYTFSHAECTSGGVPVAGSNMIQSPDDVPGVLLAIEPDQAVSCTMFSNPE